MFPAIKVNAEITKTCWHYACQERQDLVRMFEMNAAGSKIMSALVPKVTRELTKMKRTLRNVFNLDKLRPGQAQVIRAVLEGENTLAIMPTGAGKSLCYQLPTLHLPGTTVVVSPLIALMKDQVDKLEDAGLEASQLNSALSTSEHEENLEQIQSENSDFIFVTPERLTTPEFLDELRKQTINFVVIDEAHCISEWGHDFRPAYLALGAAVKTLGSPPVLALTATATPQVTADIEKQLDIGKLRVVRTGIYRPNLHFEVKRVTNELEKHEQLVRVLREYDGTGIIYCATVKMVEALTQWLKDFDFKVEKYHGRMKASDRNQNQEAFMAGELQAIVATNAFGMGIDKPDIRFVIHYQMPGSLEAYYQEAGRAGRDGEQALCSLFYQLEDRRTQQFFIGGKNVSEETKKKNKEKLERMMQYGQSAMCRWRLLHDYFDEEMEEERCGTCDNCVHPLEEQLLVNQRASPVTQINGHT